MSDKMKMLMDVMIFCGRVAVILLASSYGWLLVRSVPGASVPLMPEDQNKENR